MAGRKLFTNKCPYRSNVTLVIRSSDNPKNTAGTKDFWLDPHQSAWQEYGDNVNIYLNGIKLATYRNGQLLGQQEIVIVRGSELDDRLNMHNAVDIALEGGSYRITTRQVKL
ncbi:MAG TPA: hypothetical protein VGJ60_11500 [Chloroflexota bacterium]